MATIAVIVAGAAINALAFSGTNFLFSKLSGHGEAERKRHNEAVEKLQAAQAQWVKDRQRKIDWFNKQREVQIQAGKSLRELEDDMYKYYIATSETEPKLSDYYVASKQQQNSELSFVLGSLTLLGFVAYKYL